MSDDKAEISAIAPSIKGAMRRARIEDAERSDVIAELRGAELARLEMLAEKLEPVYAQLPDDIDIFDAGVVPGERPRLFIDMIGFIDMGADKRTYRFIQDTRHGRVVIKETDRIEAMVEAITDHIGRRLLERERALASDRTIEEAARALVSQAKERNEEPEAAAHTPTHDGVSTKAQEKTQSKAQDKSQAPKQTAMAKAEIPAGKPAAEPASRRSAFAWLWDTIEFLALFIGFVVMLIGLAGAVYYVWRMGDLSFLSKFFSAGS
jgi:hypothetical protein